MEKIETGIDRLVQLVGRERKISLEDAAKRLGVPKEVVQEWVDFLDEEGLISVQYSLSNVFLQERQLSKKEVEKKEKEYSSKREAFIRKVDTTLKKLESETAGFEEIKKQYYALKQEIGDEIQQVKDEIDELRHYEDLKKSIDRDIIQQKVDYEKALGDIHRRISNEEKRYARVLEEIGAEAKRIMDEKNDLAEVKAQEAGLRKRIEALQDVVQTIQKQLAMQDKDLDIHEERLLTLKTLAESLEKEIKEKRERELLPLIETSNRHQEKILKIQEDIIAKIKARKEQIAAYETQGKEIAARFEKFFERKAQTERLVTELEKQKAEMQKELQDLISKAKGFDLATKNSDVQKHIAELNSKFDQFDRKREGFASQLRKLRDMIGKEEDEESVSRSPERSFSRRRRITPPGGKQLLWKAVQGKKGVGPKRMAPPTGRGSKTEAVEGRTRR